MRVSQFGSLLAAGVLAWAIGRWFLSSIADPSALWDAEVKLVQAIVAVGLLIVGWKQSQTAIEQLRINEEGQFRNRLADLRDEIQRLKDNKPIVFVQKAETGGYRMVNVGKALAVNVWLLEANDRLRPLAALAAGESRTLEGPATQHLFIAEARPHTGRRFTPTMNARTSGGDVCHGFLEPENPQSLKTQGNVRDYLGLEPNLFRRFTEWQP